MKIKKIWSYCINCVMVEFNIILQSNKTNQVLKQFQNDIKKAHITH